MASSVSMEHNQYLQRMWDNLPEGKNCMVNWRVKKDWKKYKAKIKIRPNAIGSKFTVVFVCDGCEEKVNMLSIFENPERAGIVTVGWEDEEDEEEQEEQEGQQEELFGEYNTEATEVSSTPDKGQQIGDFWSRVVYKVRFSKHQLNGRVIETNGDEYFVRQCNVGNLEFKGKAWSLKARDIKTKNK